jgi:hypothetical protein
MKTYFALMSFACIVFAVGLAIRRFAVWIGGVATIGTICGHQTITTEDSVGYVPVVEFLDSQGNLRRFVSGSGDFPKRRNVGTTVKVIYSQSNHNSAYICSFWHLWITPISIAVLGIIVFVFTWP